jgi:hypothetical protein
MDQELISYLDKRFDETAQRIEAVRGELRTEIREQVGAVREELRSDIATVRGEVRTEIRQLGVTVEALRTQIQTVAEGVVTVDEKLERFRQENSAEHDEIKSMIKFSYAELDRRIIQLEASTRNLEARVGRLEAARK